MQQIYGERHFTSPFLNIFLELVISNSFRVMEERLLLNRHIQSLTLRNVFCRVTISHILCTEDLLIMSSDNDEEDLPPLRILK
jgi:hypothetical protein